MEKNIKNTIVWVFALLLLSGCYDDKGSYDYHDINEVAVTLPETQGVRLPKADSVLIEIVPELKQTLVEKESNLAFLWQRKLDRGTGLDWQVCGEEKKCQIYIKPENTEDIRLRLSIKDNTEGTVWYKEMVLKIIQPYSSTWFVLQNDGGKSVLGAVDGEGSSSVVIRDVYREDTGKEWNLQGTPRCLTGNIHYGSPMSSMPPFLGWNPIVYRVIMVLTDQDMEILGASTFETIWSLENMLMQEGITFSPQSLLSRDGTSGGDLLINDGKMYYANMDGYSVYNSVQAEGGRSYSVRVEGNIGSHLFTYDEENHRFLSIEGGWSDYLERNVNKYIRNSGDEFVDRPLSFELIGENEENDDTKNVFDPDNVDPVLKMVSMSEMSGGKQMLAFACHTADRKVHVFEFSEDGWISGNKENARCSGKFEIPFPEGVNGDDLCFITSQGFERVFFMASGNKIYKVDLNRTVPKVSVIYEHENAGVKVTGLKFKHFVSAWDDDWNEIPYHRMLGAALDYGSNQGGIVEMQLNTAGDVDRNSNRTFEYKGFGKIVDFYYTFK